MKAWGLGRTDEEVRGNRRIKKKGVGKRLKIERKRRQGGSVWTGKRRIKQRVDERRYDVTGCVYEFCSSL